jgi:hypothetical protein
MPTNPWIGGALLIVPDHIKGKVRLGLTPNQSMIILYHHDNVPFCNSVPLCHIYCFVTVPFSNVPF